MVVKWPAGWGKIKVNNGTKFKIFYLLMRESH